MLTSALRLLPLLTVYQRPATAAGPRGKIQGRAFSPPVFFWRVAARFWLQPRGQHHLQAAGEIKARIMDGTRIGATPEDPGPHRGTGR